MILQTLAEYHREQVAIGNPNYAPNGMELKRIHYVLVLREDGVLIDVEKPEDKICVVKSRERVGKDAPLTANRLWDNLGYVVGYGSDEKQRKAALIQHRSFVELVNKIQSEYPDNSSFAAVVKFYSHSLKQLYEHPLWEEIISKPGHNLSFALRGEALLASQQKELLSYGGVTRYSRCVISGNKSMVVHTHPKLHISGCSPTGTKLVSFTKVSGYDSYGKKGSENAPTSVEITESYSAALTGLMQSQSDNRIIINNVTFVFYTLPDNDFNSLLYSLLGADVDDNRPQVLQRIKTNIPQYADAEFVLIALVPNAARISVRLYLRCSVAQVSANILKYYQDMELSLNNIKQNDAASLLSSLFVISRRENIKTLPPQVIIDYIEAVLCGTKFPVLFQQKLLCRINEKSDRTFVIQSLLKCYLIRNHKAHISMSLDAVNRNIGYVLGRLLAISERAQELSNPNISYTIKDIFYSTMSMTPSFIFNRLVNSTGTFVRRIPTQGATVFIKTQFGEVMEMLDETGVPNRLSIDQQSYFAIGYFHQRQTYFKKREINEPDNRE